MISTEQSSGNGRRKPIVSLVLIVAGLSISVYLLFHSFSLMGNEKGLDICSEVFGTGCDEAMKSPVSMQLGIPLAGWGIAYFVTLASLVLLAVTIGPAFRFESSVAAFLLSCAAACASIALLVFMLVNATLFCPLCAAIHAINIALVFPLKRFSGASAADIGGALRSGMRFLFLGKAADPREARWKLVGFLLVLIVGVAAYQWVRMGLLQRAEEASSRVNPQEVIEVYENAAQHDIPVNEEDPYIGKPDAPVHMVVFSDFQCPACRGLARIVPNLVMGYKGKIHVVYKNFPLGRPCNPTMRTNLHEQACRAAWAADAARQQGKFWEMHNELYKVDLKADPHAVERIAKSLGIAFHGIIGPDKDAARAKISADIALGISLKVSSTPAVFINGRRCLDVRGKALDTIIAHLLEKKKK